MATYYMLNEEHHVVPTSDVLVWGEWFERHDKLRQVGLTKVGDRVVSTVFLGVNCNFGRGPPLLFETMVKRDGEGWDDQVRYSSWDDAEAGHKATVRRCEHEASWEAS